MRRWNVVLLSGLLLAPVLYLVDRQIDGAGIGMRLAAWTAVALVVGLLLAAGQGTGGGRRTSGRQLADWLERRAERIERRQPLVFVYRGVKMVCLYHEAHDRMRIMATVAGLDTLSQSSLASLLSAQFDRVYDARFAIQGDALLAVFVHPLSSLCERDAAAALDQIVNLVESYATAPSGGALRFTGGNPLRDGAVSVG